jgi:glycosyltransferase involved in cell wall biosynthesis
MGDAHPRVSVVVPAWNRAALACEAVASVLAQTYRDFEVLVVDDGSTDGTAEAVRARFAGEPRVRVLRKENGGTATARNHGVEHARGGLIAFLDSDDLFLPGNLAAQVARLDASPEAALSVCDARYEGGWDRDGLTVFGATRRPPPASLEDVLDGGWILPSCTMLRADVARAVPFDPSYRWTEDSEFLARFFAAGHRRVVEPAVLTVYRKHPGQGSAPQKMTERAEARKQEAMRLLEAWASRSGDPDAVRVRLHRKRAQALVREGRLKEARPHLWVWWRHEPWEPRILAYLVRSLFSSA